MQANPVTTDDTLRPDDKSSLPDTDYLDDARFEALCDAIAQLCRGHTVSIVRSALAAILAAILAETYAQLPIAERPAKVGYLLAVIRQYVREMPP